MGQVLAFNGKNRGHWSGEVDRSTDYYSVMSDGRLSYTPEGIVRFGPVFREHDIDIRKVETEDDHRIALDICATEAVNGLSGSESESLNDLELRLLRTVMTDQDNEEAKRLEAQLRFRRGILDENARS